MNKYIKIKTIIFLLFVCLFGIFGSNSAKASWWGENFGANGVQIMIEELKRQIKDMALGAEKQAAAEMVINQVDSILSGSSGSGSLIIQDWDEYLFEASTDNTNLYVNDLISASMGGKNSNLNYIPAGGNFNYSHYLAEYTKKQLGGGGSIKKNSFIEEIIGDPTVSMTGTAGWRRFSALRESNPIGNTLKIQSAMMEKQRQEEKKAEIKAIIGGGYKGIESGGQTITPGSTVKSLKDQSQAMSFNIISSANSIPEVITSVMSRVVLQTFQKGVGSARSNINKEENSTPQTPKPWINPNSY